MAYLTLSSSYYPAAPSPILHILSSLTSNHTWLADQMLNPKMKSSEMNKIFVYMN